MKNKLTIKPQRVKDAKRYFEILSNPHFKYFNVQVRSVEEEKKFLKLNTEKRRQKREFNFGIHLNEKLVGGIGVRVDGFRSYIGEIGYFVDETYWGKGIASKALRLIERFSFQNLKLKRIEILVITRNKASLRVALKCGYQQEGILKKKLVNNKVYHDAYLLAKTR
ncbi:MAG: GNAT family N-acetyltransferase [Deltaproteobacteria bacterium]|nr:GNAT family N-acetyltransferase [Deltaproteobacteria bacterium]